MATLDPFVDVESTQQEDFSKFRVEFAKIAEQLKALSIVCDTAMYEAQSSGEKERAKKLIPFGDNTEINQEEEKIRREKCSDIVQLITPAVSKTNSLNDQFNEICKKWDVMPYAEGTDQHKLGRALQAYYDIQKYSKPPSELAKDLSKTLGPLANTVKGLSVFCEKIADSKFVSAAKLGPAPTH